MNIEELEKIKKGALKRHIPIIMDDTLKVIKQYLESIKPRRILEIGTAVGYSAICFTEFLSHNRPNWYNWKGYRESRWSKRKYKKSRSRKKY